MPLCQPYVTLYYLQASDLFCEDHSPPSPASLLFINIFVFPVLLNQINFNVAAMNIILLGYYTNVAYYKVNHAAGWNIDYPLPPTLPIPTFTGWTYRPIKESVWMLEIKIEEKFSPFHIIHSYSTSIMLQQKETNNAKED